MKRSNNYNNIFMICTCAKYEYRQPLLETMYKQYIKNDDTYIFLKGNMNINQPILKNNTLILNCGDLYENLPEKVVFGIQYITKNFSFNKLIKVDDDIVIHFKLFYNLLHSLPNNNLYYGKKNLQYSNNLNTHWHINKLSKEHPLNNKSCPETFFPINDNEYIQYPCGPCYILSNDVCNIILHFNEKDITYTKNHIYEDINLYTLLSKYNITSLFHNTKKYLLLLLPTILKKNLKKLSTINKPSTMNSSTEKMKQLQYTTSVFKNNVEKNKNIYSIKTFLYNNNFFKKYQDILTFHIGSISNRYVINKTSFKNLFIILNIFNSN